MAKRSTPTDRVVLDSLFNIPEGAEDQFVHSEEDVYDAEITSDEFTYLDSLDVGYEDELPYDDGTGDEDDFFIEAPTNFTIISQTLRRGPGGYQVVDLVIEVEDVEGAVNYEVQVTKA